MGNCLSRLIFAAFILMTPFVFSHCATEESSELQTVTPQYPISQSGFIWPLLKKHRVSRSFGEESFDHHEGLDIPAPQGTEIHAASDGHVVYAGHVFHGYGNMILIEHAQSVATIYGHCYKLFVRSGQFVNRGDVIALVGKTGRATAPHLHFEVRLNRRPVDPLVYLP